MINCQHCKATPATIEVMKESKVYQKKERLYLCDYCEVLDRYDGINWTWRTTTPYVQQEDSTDEKTCTYNNVHTPTNTYTTFQTNDQDIIKWLKSILPDMTDDIIITDHQE